LLLGRRIEEMNDGILLASGGMDSTVLAFWLVDRGVNPVPLFIDYGQHCARSELTCLEQMLPKSCKPALETVDVSGIYRHCTSRLIVEADLWTDAVKADDLYIPYRNLLLLSIGAAVAQARGMPVVYSAFINSNRAREIDCSQRFFDALSEVLVEFGSVKIEMPFRHMTKSEVARLGVTLGVPIAETYSCQVNSETHCGVCPNCVDRLVAFEHLRRHTNDRRR
jgi:7-cyano-7-deazaguanine synthase